MKCAGLKFPRAHLQGKLASSFSQNVCDRSSVAFDFDHELDEKN